MCIAWENWYFMSILFIDISKTIAWMRYGDGVLRLSHKTGTYCNALWILWFLPHSMCIMCRILLLLSISVPNPFHLLSLRFYRNPCDLFISCLSWFASNVMHWLLIALKRALDFMPFSSLDFEYNSSVFSMSDISNVFLSILINSIILLYSLRALYFI